MTCSQLNCLLELRHLSEESRDVSSVTLTKRLGLSKPSVHRLLEGLKRLELIDKEYYGTARLTPKGAEIAGRMSERAELLSERLGQGIIAKDKARSAALMLLSSMDENEFSCFEQINASGDGR